jgi:hypothetical protein
MVGERAGGGLNLDLESAWEIGDDYSVGERVIVARDPGVEPATAEVRAADYRRPHLVKVQYVNSRAAAWIARSRILRRAPDNESAGTTTSRLAATDRRRAR